MSVKPYITIRAADEKARFAANELREVLKDFNEQHPDPDAELVAESLEYVDDDYLVRICALTIAEAHIVGPEIPGALEQSGFELWLGETLTSDQKRSAKGMDRFRNKDEVETG